jgi:hypothetical protein
LRDYTLLLTPVHGYERKNRPRAVFSEKRWRD